MRRGAAALRCRLSRLLVAAPPRVLRPPMATLAAPPASPAPPRKPVVLVIGPTGAGKSQIGIDLAARFNGEVVNADVIQMYRALDIASAKVPVEERGGVPHHLLSFLRPRQQFSVRDFRRMALAAIDDISSRGKLPIVVGGTMYYVQSLIRPSLLEEDEAAAVAGGEEGGGEGGGAAGSAVNNGSTGAVEGSGAAGSGVHASSGGGARDCGASACHAASDCGASSASSAAAASMPAPPGTSSLWEQLRAVDPVMANRLHPRDLRKIERALSVYQTTGLPYSEVIRRQEERLGKGAAADPASNEAAAGELSPFIVWVRATDRSVHASRLDARVDKMMRLGLISEIEGLQDYLKSTPAEAEGPTLAAEAAAAAAVCDDVAAAPPAPGASALSLSMDAPTPLTLQIVHRLLTAASSGVTTAFLGVAHTIGHLMAAAAAKDESGSASCQGLLQAIGFKEFSAYLAARAAAAATSATSKEASSGSGEGAAAPPAAPDAGAEGSSGSATEQPVPPPPAKRRKAAKPHPDPVALALAAGIEALKVTTHGYARKQERWIINRFQRRGVEMLQVDTSGVESGEPGWWEEAVVAPTAAALTEWLATGALPRSATAGVSEGTDGSGAAVPAPPPALSDAARLFSWEQHVCAPCGGRVLNGAKAWEEHLGSKGHRAALAYEKRRAALAAERGILLPPFQPRRAGGGSGSHGNTTPSGDSL